MKKLDYIKRNLKYAIMAISVFLIYYILNKKFGFSIPCIFYKITGLYCPGCGITRLLFALVNLEFYESFKYNPWIFILIVLGLFYLICKLFIFLKLKKIIKIPNYVYITLIIISIIFGIFRNIPGFEFLGP